jgi:hypothetical protein
MLTRMFFSEDDKDDPETGVVLSGGQWQRVALARATPGCSGSRPVATRRRLSPDNDGAAPARPHGWAGAAFSIVSSRSR